MGYKEKILNLLSKEPLTSEELASKLNISENEVRVYLSRLKERNKAQVIDKKERYKVYTVKKPIDSKEKAEIQELKYLLSQIYNLMKYKFDKKTDLILSEEDITLLEKIKEILEKDDLLSQIKK